MAVRLSLGERFGSSARKWEAFHMGKNSTLTTEPCCRWRRWNTENRSGNHCADEGGEIMIGKLKLGTARAEPGQKDWGQLHVRQGNKKVSLPVCIVNGARPGPHVVLVANQHGQEVNGLESVRRFCEDVLPRKLRGTLFAIPSMNPVATMLQQQTWNEGDRKQPTDLYHNKYNMNRIWPGRKGGLLVERVAYEVWHQLIHASHRRASLVMDFHCHDRTSAIYAFGLKSQELGVLTGLPYIFQQGDTTDCPANLLKSCDENGITGITVELGRQRVFNRTSITDGVRVIRNLLKFWGMLEGELELPQQAFILDPWGIYAPKSFRGRTYIETHCRHDGVFVPHRLSLEHVREGDLICEVVDPHKGRVVQ